MDEGKYLEPALPEFFSERVQGYGLMKIWRGGVATNKERLLPRLRAETSPLMKGAKLSSQGVSSQADEDGNYGVQARRREGEAAG
jgi:hypothetical protein